MPKGLRIFFKDFKNSNNAASELIGTVLLLGLTVAIFSIIYTGVLSVNLDVNEPNPRIIAKIEGSNIILEHCGGERLGLDTKVKIVIQNETTIKTVGELLIDSNKDEHWNIGEKLAYPVSYSINPLEADITSIDIEGKKIILTGSLDFYPECDVGVEIFVNKKYPKILDNILITIKATLYNGDTDATDIKIEYIIPENLTYVSYTSTQGFYNNETGIWDVGDLKVKGSATVKIMATILGSNINTVKILNSIPPDPNANNDIASVTIVPQDL